MGTDFIGLLVLGVLNASIPKASVRPEFVCSKLPPLEWHSQKHPKHVIRVGSHVKFHVDKLQEPGAFFSIYGSLKAKGGIGFGRQAWFNILAFDVIDMILRYSHSCCFFVLPDGFRHGSA